MSVAVRQLITKLRAVNIEEPSVLQDEIARIDQVANNESSNTRSLAASVSELIYLRHQGHPLQDKYGGLCERLLQLADAEGDTAARETAMLGAELLCGASHANVSVDVTVSIPVKCVDIMNGGWSEAAERVSDVVQWVNSADGDAVVVMHCVRVLKWVCEDDERWGRRRLLAEWMKRYSDGEMGAIGVVCELVVSVGEAADMVQLCVKRNDGVGRRWFLQKLEECCADVDGISASMVMEKIDWRYLIKAGDVDLVFAVLREVVEWTRDEGVNLVRVLLHCATLSSKRRHVWDVILRIVNFGVPDELLCKALVVFARTGGDVGVSRVEKLAGVVMENGSKEVRGILAQLVEKGSCEAFLQVYLLASRQWESRDYAAAVKRYPGCSLATKMLMIDWFNDGGFELEEEIGVLRERVREATARRHELLRLPPIEEYVRMLKFDIGIIEIGGVKVKFKIRREGYRCEMDLRWSSDDANVQLRTFGDSYGVEETQTSTSLTIVVKIRKLYPEWEEPVLVMNDEECRLPFGLKTMRAQGMPLAVFEKRWSVLPRAIKIEGISIRAVERMGASITGNSWCCLVYTENGVVGVLGRDDEVKCTKDEEFVVARLRRAK